MNQNFRISKVKESYLIFPFPPIKGSKWLIKCKTEEEAKDVLNHLASNNIPTPISQTDEIFFTLIGHHTDGATPIFSLKEKNLHSQKE